MRKDSSYIKCDSKIIHTYIHTYFIETPFNRAFNFSHNVKRKENVFTVAYGISRNETKRNETNLIDKEITVHRVGDITKIYSFSWKPVLARCLVSQKYR